MGMWRIGCLQTLHVQDSLSAVCLVCVISARSSCLVIEGSGKQSRVHMCFSEEHLENRLRWKADKPALTCSASLQGRILSMQALSTPSRFEHCAANLYFPGETVWGNNSLRSDFYHYVSAPRLYPNCNFPQEHYKRSHKSARPLRFNSLYQYGTRQTEENQTYSQVYLPMYHTLVFSGSH